MRCTVRGRLLVLPAILLSLAGAAHPATAQRAGESGGALDIKSGRFANVFAGAPARAPDTLATTDAQIFAALPAVFDALAVPVSVVDTTAMVLGALRVPVRRPIAGQRLSLLLECGTGNYGPNAERYSVQLTLLAAVRAVDATPCGWKRVAQRPQYHGPLFFDGPAGGAIQRDPEEAARALAPALAMRRSASAIFRDMTRDDL